MSQEDTILTHTGLANPRTRPRKNYADPYSGGINVCGVPDRRGPLWAPPATVQPGPAPGVTGTAAYTAHVSGYYITHIRTSS